MIVTMFFGFIKNIDADNQNKRVKKLIQVRVK
jgi:hypothetical protein